jgi:hypothetical protein
MFKFMIIACEIFNKLLSCVYIKIIANIRPYADEKWYKFGKPREM